MSQRQRLTGSPEVVILGGGVTALEALMALRAHAGEELDITLVAPEPDFVPRAMMVAEPFDVGSVRRLPVAAGRVRLRRTRAARAVTAVDADERRVILRSGGTVGYDTLILAPGPRMLRAFDDVIAFGGRTAARRCASCSPTSTRAARAGSRSSRRPRPAGCSRSMSWRS